MNSTLSKQCVAEFIGTFTLIFVGIGAIANNTPTAGLRLLTGWPLRSWSRPRAPFRAGN
jgi:glycerol uptake facilitator-like aquaporin